MDFVLQYIFSTLILILNLSVRPFKTVRESKEKRFYFIYSSSFQFNNSNNKMVNL